MAKKKPVPQTQARYEVITQEDPETGDLIIPIPPQILEQLGWKEGDDVEFDISKDGTIYIKRASA